MNTLRQSAINQQPRTVNELTKLQKAIGKLPDSYVFNMFYGCRCVLGFAAKNVYDVSGASIGALHHLNLDCFGFSDIEHPFISVDNSRRLTRDEAIMMLEAVKICVEEGI